VSTSSYAERIAAIDTILAGPELVMLGDRQVRHNFAELRKERAYLLRLSAGSSASSFRRVVFKGGSAL
jgi:hypothetical protein